MRLTDDLRADERPDLAGMGEQWYPLLFFIAGFCVSRLAEWLTR